MNPFRQQGVSLPRFHPERLPGVPDGTARASHPPGLPNGTVPAQPGVPVAARLLCSLALLAASAYCLAEPGVRSTEVIGGFSGHYTAVHPANQEPEPIAYYGTDLGFTYSHQGELKILFGDTWATESYAPIEASTGSRFDDGFGSIDLSEWTDPSKITVDNIPVIKLGQNPGTSEMSAMNPGHAMDLGKTPMAGFSSGDREFAIFNVTKPKECASDSDCGGDLSCDTGLGYIGTPSTTEENLTIACLDGQPGCQSDTMSDAEGNAVSPSGLCADPTASIWANTEVGRMTAAAINQRVGLRSDDDPRIYGDIREWLTTKFLNVTATTVENWAPPDGKRADKPDFRPATSHGGQQRVFLWGRPGFVGVKAQDRSLALYFAYADLPEGPGFKWDLHYYAGSENGTPVFSKHEKDAVPLDLDASANGVQATEHHDVVHQMSVEWVAELSRWVMFYGGSVSTIPSPFLPSCGVLEIFSRSACKEVDLENGAIRMRTARNPWGPWTVPQDVLVGGDPKVPGSGQYGPGGVLHHPDCTEEGCAPHSKSPYYNPREYGFLYSANIITEWTRPAGNGVDVLWNASTWDPYRVVLLRTRIEP
jgi:hypothetical protein